MAEVATKSNGFRQFTITIFRNYEIEFSISITITMEIEMKSNTFSIKIIEMITNRNELHINTALQYLTLNLIIH